MSKCHERFGEPKFFFFYKNLTENVNLLLLLNVNYSLFHIPIFQMFFFSLVLCSFYRVKKYY